MRRAYPLPHGPVAAAALAVAAVAFASASAFAEEPLPGANKLVDPRALGLAEALRAAPGSVSGVYLNPATISMARVYHAGLMYQYTSRDELHMGGAGIVDSVTSRYIAAGLAVNYTGGEQRRSDHSGWDVRLSLAGNVADTFFIGVTGRYVRVEHDLSSAARGPNGVPALPRSGSQQLDGFTFDAGAGLRFADVIRIGVVGYNLTDTGSVYAPIQLAPAISATLFDMLLIETDVVLDFTSHDDLNEEVRAGAELFIANVVPIRVGYVYDVFYAQHSIAAGVGYVDPRFGVDVGFQHELRTNGRMFLAFGLRIFLQ